LPPASSWTTGRALRRPGSSRCRGPEPSSMAGRRAGGTGRRCPGPIRNDALAWLANHLASQGDGAARGLRS
jgi:hypothetical protein